MDISTHLTQRTRRAFGDGVETHVAAAVLGFIAAHPGTTQITLWLVRQLTGSKGDAQDAAILKTLQYLAGDSLRALNTKFELIEDELMQHILTDEELNAVLTLGINPVTGEHDPAIKEKVGVFFTPSDELLTALGAFKKEGGA